jgi:DNA-binding XRE family transcriptional regulator
VHKNRRASERRLQKRNGEQKIFYDQQVEKEPLDMIGYSYTKKVLDSLDQRTIAVNFIALRLKKGWTQEQMADKLKWSHQKISRFEAKKDDSMTVRDVIAYSHALGYRLSIKVAQLKGTK